MAVEVSFMRLVPAFLLVGFAAAPLLVAGCGGEIAAAEHQADGGPLDDAPAGAVPPPPTSTDDAQPPPFDAPARPFDVGACLVDLEPCLASTQCCSGLCNVTNVCGPLVSPPPPPPPPCQPDGYRCQSGAQCCGGSCDSGRCGPAPIFDAGVCLPDGDACMTYADCCSGVCGAGVCGGAVFDSGPTCAPDGYGCQSYTDCCSGVCAYGACGAPGVDAGPPPPACSPPGPTTCDACFAAACCAQLGACEADPTCSAALGCFTTCYVPGTGNAASCSSRCGQQDPSPAGNALSQCAASSCTGACN